MSSSKVRQVFAAEIAAKFPTLDTHDLSEYTSISDLPPNSGADATLLLQFPGSSEEMVDIAGEGNQGWMERGSVVLHYLIPTGFDYKIHLPQMDNIHDNLRGRRLADGVVIESVSPFTDQMASAVRIDGGWHGWVSYVSFNRYVCG